MRNVISWWAVEVRFLDRHQQVIGDREYLVGPFLRASVAAEVAQGLIDGLANLSHPDLVALVCVQPIERMSPASGITERFERWQAERRESWTLRPATS